MIKKLWAKYVLWEAGYCLRHGIPKKVGHRTIWCQACDYERDAKAVSAIEAAKKLLNW